MVKEKHNNTSTKQEDTLLNNILKEASQDDLAGLSFSDRLGMRATKLPAYQAFIREFLDPSWPDDYQSIEEIDRVRGVGILLAAGMRYEQQKDTLSSASSTVPAEHRTPEPDHTHADSPV